MPSTEGDMGQLESSAFDDDDITESTVLQGDRSVNGIVRAIKEGRIKKICVLVGAGISCSAGIPDFKTGADGFAHPVKLRNRLRQEQIPLHSCLFHYTVQ